MRRLVLAVGIVMLAAMPVQAQVHIDIGIRIPSPPPLVVVPGAPVYYAPSAPANVFFYGERYWVYHANGWHVGPTWSGPWVVVAPVYVPVPILRVPVRYYKVPPGHWRTWRHDGPPRWDVHYGRDWREDDHEKHWREREERWHHAGHRDHDRDGDRDRHPGKGKGHGKGHSKGKGKKDD